VPLSVDRRERSGEDRLLAAERQGLKIGIACRSVAAFLALIWFVGGSLAAGSPPTPAGLLVLAAFAAFGVFNYLVIGTRLDRWWLKYLLSAVDILGLCSFFVIVPLSGGGAVPQILVFKAYGIYFLFPLIVLSALSLSWQLVAWSGVVAVAGWWAAFLLLVRDMPRTLSWGDLPAGATAAEYQQLFLSPDFIGVGNRTQESGLLLISALILSVAVWRARRVFFAQLEAEAGREAERVAREAMAFRFGRYLPEAIAERLANNEESLAPSVRHGVVLIMDVSDFTAFAEGRDPAEVIGALDAVLAGASEAVSHEGGVVISFTGDGLLATFNVPLDIPAPEDAALRAAVALVAQARKAEFAVRVGLAAGPIAAGSIGSPRRQAFTVYGDTVNLAARLEQLAKPLGRTILLDDAVARRARIDGLVDLGEQAIRGRLHSVRVFALTAETDGAGTG
jgi:adenylate cyclase